MPATRIDPAHLTGGPHRGGSSVHVKSTPAVPGALLSVAGTSGRGLRLQAQLPQQCLRFLYTFVRRLARFADSCLINRIIPISFLIV